jgi:intracellular sulfur oxidation DsrE/DsrF family protein
MRLAFVVAFVLASTAGALADPVFGTLGSGGPVMTSPTPSIDHPRKVVLSLSESALPRVNEVIGNVGNIQKFYGADNVRIALVAYGPGIHAVLQGSPVKDRIEGLLAIGVHVLACKATLDTIHANPNDLIPGVQVVSNGLPEIVELQLRGWTYVRP